VGDNPDGLAFYRSPGPVAFLPLEVCTLVFRHPMVGVRMWFAGMRKPDAEIMSGLARRKSKRHETIPLVSVSWGWKKLRHRSLPLIHESPIAQHGFWPVKETTVVIASARAGFANIADRLRQEEGNCKKNCRQGVTDYWLRKSEKADCDNPERMAIHHQPTIDNHATNSTSTRFP